MSDIDQVVDVQLTHVSDRLIHDYAGQVPGDVVRSLVAEAYGSFTAARVTQFVPVLVDRAVRERLGHGVREIA